MQFEKIKKDSRKNLLAALFVKAKNRGIEPDELREDIAPIVINKRISEASVKELVSLIEHITKYKNPSNTERKYPSSRDGLIQELEDAARARWSDGWTQSLNAFVNSHSDKAVTHYKFLSVAALKAIKGRIVELNKESECQTKS